MIEGELTAGRATGEGTRRYADRFADLPGHFRRPDALWLSSIGLGTRGGDPGGPDDLGYRSAVSRAVEVGVNVFDTALSYRMQTSERALGRALGRAFAEGAVARDEVCVMSKGGYLTIDLDQVRDRSEARTYLYTTYVDSGLIDPDELVHGRHTLSRRFLQDQIERSRRNLGLATIDVYFLQDPEIQLEEKGPDEFRRVLIEAIETLEEAAHKGSIGAYGISTWNGLLVPHTERGHLSVAELFDTALDVGGADHHMRAIQLPYSVAMAEAQGLDSQFGAESRATGALDTLRDTGTAVFAIAPLVQGRAVRGLPRFLLDASPELESDAQVALQFARSAPAITSALVGMRGIDHVDENLAVARSAPLSNETIARLFAEAARAER
jgi:aryl-alcohol dehydrogenase-like predicted oxidoreductase